jgi:hypothetical protein
MKASSTILLCLCLLLSGCGRRHGPRPATHPVDGKLSVAGTPAVGARVTLYPVASKEKYVERPRATVEADGSYHLTTFNTRDGAPEGEFALSVVWPGPRLKNQAEDEEGPDRLLGRYADPKRPAARVRIEAQTRSLEPIDLKPVEEKTPAKDNGITPPHAEP